MNELSTLTNSTVQALIELPKPSASQMTGGLKKLVTGICFLEYVFCLKQGKK